MRNSRPFRVLLAFAPLAASLAAWPATYFEEFASDPAVRGWTATGETSLFQWDSVARNLAVTWNSAQPNSYFLLPLRTFLTRDDDFTLEFDLRLQSIAVGTTPGKASTFEIALGFINRAQATGAGFWRGSGVDSPNLVEWDYFPDSGFGATVAAAMISGSHQWATSFNAPVELILDQTYHFRLDYQARTRTLEFAQTVGGQSTRLEPATIKSGFGDFAVDALAISSYSDVGQDPMYGGSVFARGTVDNVRLELPEPPIRRFTGGPDGATWQAGFTGWLGWRYTLEASSDLSEWNAVSATIDGDGHRQTLVDPHPSPDRSFYRLQAMSQ